MSAGDFPTFSAIVCGRGAADELHHRQRGLRAFAGRRDRRTAAAFACQPGASGAAAGPRRAAAGAEPRAGASGARLSRAGFGPPAFLALGLRGAGGGSSTSRRLGVAAVALPPRARSRGTRSSGTLEEADRPVTPICSRVASELLAGDPQFLRQFVNPHTLPYRSFRSLPSLAASSAVRPVRSARANAPSDRGLHAARRRGARTPRGPAPTPTGRRPPSPSRTRTTRSSAASVAFPRHPTQVRSGDAIAHASAGRLLGGPRSATSTAAPPGRARPPRRRRLLATAAGSASATAAGSSAAGSSTGAAAAGAGAAGRDSSATCVSDLMSIRHPVSRAASRAFCPSLPIASDSW